MKIPESYNYVRLDIMTFLNDPNQRYRLALIPGMRMVEDRSLYDDDRYRCAHYVFGHKQTYDESWARPGWEIDYRSWENTERALAKRGYVIDEKLDPGCIIGYRHAGLISYAHFGIYQVDGTVTSKFGSKDIWNHELEYTPINWGNEYFGIHKVGKPKRFHILGISIG